jgi:hypothetical protein
MNAWRRLLMAGLLLVGCAIGARASDVAWPVEHQLPTTKSVLNWHPPVAFKFNVQQATANDLAGQPTGGIPAWQIDVLTGTGDWDRGLPTPPPEFVMKSTTSQRSRIALFKGSSFGGWLAVPRGWRVQVATEGVDGSGGITFVAPGGARQGWMTYGVIPACVGCILGAADGLFPDAHRRYDAFLGTHTPPETLSPKPDSLTHPDQCTVLITYRSGGLMVEGIYFWLPPLSGGPDPYSTELSVALPAKDASLQDYLITAFERTRPASQQACPQSGW